MTDTNMEAAIADALQRLKDATDRHKAAVKTLEDFENVLGRVTASRTNPNPVPVTSWGIAVDYHDMRYEGGIHVGGYGKPILPWQWLSGEQIVATIQERNE